MRRNRVVGHLYGEGAAHLTAALISTERIAILESGMDDETKERSVGNLYVAGGAHLTEELLSIERDSRAVGGLYSAEGVAPPVAVIPESFAIPSSNSPVSAPSHGCCVVS